MKKIVLLSISLFSLLMVSQYSLAAHFYSTPKGSYKKSCWGCRMDRRGRLHCMCKDRQGFPNMTKFGPARDCRFVVNHNGKLHCKVYRKKIHRGRRNYRGSIWKVWLNAGPIWNQAHAQTRCPSVCGHHRRAWSGQWRTTTPNEMSVCECVR